MSSQSSSRRKFLKNTTRAGIALTSLSTIPSILQASAGEPAFNDRPFITGFTQQPLGYAYTALEPVIDATTMELHYSKHASAYAKNLNEAAAAEKIDTSKSVEELMASISKYSPKVRNNGGGHYNHELFWRCMKPAADSKPTGQLLAAIEKDFGSYDAFKTKFSDAGKGRFGSGWAWLVATPDKKLVVTSTPNQDNPLMDIAEVKGVPLLGLDVWEHAYYLKYQNRRPEYIENWWKVVNWDFVASRFQ
ncbi:MAG TPA: superoxide dismutase [Flavitalea sp.]|nr:superoxide dismutase [Flavitalea sp.]